MMRAQKGIRGQGAALVAVSALSVAALAGNPALAQIVFNCPQQISVGRHAACSNGSLVINPDGSTNLTGCLATDTPPQAGQCILSTGGVPLTRNVVVAFTTNSIFMNGGGGSAKVNNFRMQPTSAPTPAAQFTFTPTQAAGGVTINIGGTLNFSNGQAIGAYGGSIRVSATLL